jgi:hypothetical protein
VNNNAANKMLSISSTTSAHICQQAVLHEIAAIPALIPRPLEVINLPYPWGQTHNEWCESNIGEPSDHFPSVMPANLQSLVRPVSLCRCFLHVPNNTSCRCLECPFPDDIGAIGSGTKMRGSYKMVVGLDSFLARASWNWHDTWWPWGRW